MSYENSSIVKDVVLNKNVFLRAHGMRIKNSFFKLEPNVNVYMKCTDTLQWINVMSQCVMMKFLLNNKNVDYLDKIIKKVKNTNMYETSVTYNSAYGGEYGILKRMDQIKEDLKNKLMN